MDIKHECTRNESIVEQYEKSNIEIIYIIFLFFSNESNKENSPRNSKKTPEEITADTATSENNVQRARAELRVLEQERSKLDKQRKIQVKEFETAKAEARRLLEVCRTT